LVKREAKNKQKSEKEKTASHKISKIPLLPMIDFCQGAYRLAAIVLYFLMGFTGYDLNAAIHRKKMVAYASAQPNSDYFALFLYYEKRYCHCDVAVSFKRVMCR
jgi:hypothetical protein